MKRKKWTLIVVNVLGLLTTLFYLLYYMVYFVETRISWSKEEFCKALEQTQADDQLAKASEILLSNIRWNQTVCEGLFITAQLLTAILVIIFIVNIIIAFRLKRSGLDDSDKTING
jgi:hypothetical protein